MAKGAPKPGKGPIVGYGDKGKAFHDQTKYNQSDSGQRHAKNPALSKKPVAVGAKGNVFFSQAKANAARGGAPKGSPLHPRPGGGGPPHQPHTPAGFSTPMPGHPSGNAAHVHGPSTIGKISGPAPRGGMK